METLSTQIKIPLSKIKPISTINKPKRHSRRPNFGSYMEINKEKLLATNNAIIRGSMENEEVKKVIKLKRFPREVFTAGDIPTISGSSTKKGKKIKFDTLSRVTPCNEKSEISPETVISRDINFTPVTTIKQTIRLKPELIRKQNELYEESPTKNKRNYSLKATPKITTCESEDLKLPDIVLPSMNRNKKTIKTNFPNVTATPRWKPNLNNFPKSNPSKQTFAGTVKFLPVEDKNEILLLSEPKKEHIRHNSNQIANLELVSHYSSNKAKPPINIMNAKNIKGIPKLIKFKSVPREISSSNGKKSIKIVIMNDANIIKIRPVSNQDSIKTTALSKIPLLEHPQNRYRNNNNRFNLLSSNIEWRNTVITTDSKKQFPELCNVTFGDMKEQFSQKA